MNRNVTIDLELCCQLTGTTDMTEAEVAMRMPAFVRKMQSQLDREVESELRLRLNTAAVCGGV